MITLSSFMRGFFLLPALLLPALPAQAQCLSGVPCVTPKTLSNPQTVAVESNSAGANAAKSESDSCDADFMNQITARAFLEAERQNVKNAILIRKPDSVMEYSCFHQTMNTVAAQADLLFSSGHGASYNWLNRTVPINGRIDNNAIPSVPINTFLGREFLDNSLNGLVMSALGSYINTSFAHDFLGGIAHGLDGNAAAGAVDPEAPYNCDMMNMVHFLAQCNNFMIDDPFFSFDDLASHDPRILPPGLQCERRPITQPLIDLAMNKDGQYVDTDPLDTLYFDRLSAGVCSAPIPTGIVVKRESKLLDLLGNIIRSPLPSYEEHVCSNPACFYDRARDSCCLAPGRGCAR